jgi:hypothetical protein
MPGIAKTYGNPIKAMIKLAAQNRIFTKMDNLKNLMVKATVPI